MQYVKNIGTLPNVTVKPLKSLLSVNERIHIGIDKYNSIKSNDIGYFVVFITDIRYACIPLFISIGEESPYPIMILKKTNDEIITIDVFSRYFFLLSESKCVYHWPTIYPNPIMAITGRTG